MILYYTIINTKKNTKRGSLSKLNMIKRHKRKHTGEIHPQKLRSVLKTENIKTQRARALTHGNPMNGDALIHFERTLKVNYKYIQYIHKTVLIPSFFSSLVIK